MSGSDASTVVALAALGEGSRLRLFEFVRRARRPVSREEAADHVGISRKLAAFHLDKLVEVGLLHTRSGAPAGRGPRVGRRPKLYAADETDIQVSIPQRDYAALADMLIEAVSDESRTEPAEQAALQVALQRGKHLGQAERGRGLPGTDGMEEALRVVERILRAQGFEPYRAGPAVVRLGNCPFHPLSAKAPHLVCGMNHAYLAGLLSGLEAKAARAFLAPQAGECCVEVRADVRSGREG